MKKFKRIFVIVMVRIETSPEDLAGMDVAEGYAILSV